MRDLVSLQCDQCKRRNYTATRNKKKGGDKLAVKKFCRACKGHTLHKEGKI